MLFATARESAAALSRAMQSGGIDKQYLALVHGTPPPSGDWEDLLFKDSSKNKVFVVKRMRNGVKAARLTYERLREGEVSAVRVRLHTGRSHQIRVQFASRGFPLVGDHKYGARDAEKAPRLFCAAVAFDWKGQHLHFEATPDWLME